MKTKIEQIMTTVLCAVVMCLVAQAAQAATAAEIDKEVQLAIEKLYKSSPVTKDLAATAKGILVFPDVLKAGFIVGAQYGEGALLENGRPVAYYNTVAASYGLQAGAQSFGYAMFLMTDKAVDYLKKSKGWEIGVGPNVVVVDKGKAKSLTTSTAKDDIYAFFFGQEGLMAGLGLQGSKITRIEPDK